MIKIDKEFQSLIPPLSEEEFAQLEENCVRDGIRDPLVVWPQEDGTDILIDGHNRWEISAKNAGIPFQLKRHSFNSREEAKEWIIKNQLGRRNIPAYVRAELVLKLKPVIQEKAKERMFNPMQNSAQGTTRDQLAKAAGVSHDTIHKVEKIQEKAPESVKESLRRGETSINKAYSDIMASENESRRQKEAKELKEAKQRHEEFQEQKTEGVINLADIKQDKEDAKLIFEEFKGELDKMIHHVRHFAIMAEDGDIRKALIGADKYERHQVADRLQECHRLVCKIQIITQEVIDEE